MITQPDQFIHQSHEHITHCEKPDQPIAEVIASLRMQEIIAQGAGFRIVRRAIPENRIRQGV